MTTPPPLQPVALPSWLHANLISPPIWLYRENDEGSTLGRSVSAVGNFRI